MVIAEFLCHATTHYVLEKKIMIEKKIAVSNPCCHILTTNPVLSSIPVLSHSYTNATKKTLHWVPV